MIDNPTSYDRIMYSTLMCFHSPWESVSMDFMTQLPKWKGMDTILMVVDWFSKLAKMAPTKMILMIFNLTKLFFNMWVKHYGMPQFIISNRDAKFTTSFWKHLF
jgi:hypothetical protein